MPLQSRTPTCIRTNRASDQSRLAAAEKHGVQRLKRQYVPCLLRQGQQTCLRTQCDMHLRLERSICMVSALPPLLTLSAVFWMSSAALHQRLCTESIQRTDSGKHLGLHRAAHAAAFISSLLQRIREAE